MGEFMYTVRGMTCGHCADAVTRGLRRIDGVSTVEVDVASGRVLVGSTRELTTEEVDAAVIDAGFELAE